MTFIAAAAVVALAGPAHAVDWNAAAGKDITLFYPGQSSWEWMLTKSDHSGGPKIRAGKHCRECHKGEEAKMGNLIVSGEKLEPDPIPGKPGTIPLNVKFAHDAERLYVRLEWTGAASPSGTKMDPDFRSKVTMMFDDGNVSGADRAGCWTTCHDDVEGMPSAPEGKELKKSIAESRTKITRKGGGENYKSGDQLSTMLSKGEYMELWQARLNPGAAPVAKDGYVLEERHMTDSPAVAAEGGCDGNACAVVLSRKLTGAGPHHKDIVPGKTYTVGFAVHDDYAEHRFHHVSFEHTFVLDQGEADFVATAQ